MPISDAGDYDLTVLDQEKQTGVVVRLDPGIPADAFDSLDDALRSISGHHRSPTVKRNRRTPAFRHTQLG